MKIKEVVECLDGNCHVSLLKKETISKTSVFGKEKETSSLIKKIDNMKASQLLESANQELLQNEVVSLKPIILNFIEIVF